MTTMSTNQSDNPRIVVLTSGGDFAHRILAGLALEQVRPRALMLVEPARPRSRRRSRHRLRLPSPRRLASAVLRRAQRLVEPAAKTVAPDPWAGAAEEIRRAGPLNGPMMLDMLRDLEPDYLVLAGLGILGPEVLAIPRRGTFNVHPGLLPWIRGISVIERALQRGIPVGITAHYVDPGIDTGAVIRRELIPVRSHDTLASLRRVAYERCAEVMVQLVADAVQGRHPEATAQQGRFPYCTALPDEDYAGLDASVRAGLALRLYRHWLEFFGSHVLPPGEDRPPGEEAQPEAGPVVVRSGTDPQRNAR
jgi:methionyl-tRNA formyltransferase